MGYNPWLAIGCKPESALAETVRISLILSSK
jgi:hypothetical protein